jgi:signal transduction histidine kinase
VHFTFGKICLQEFDRDTRNYRYHDLRSDPGEGLLKVRLLLLEDNARDAELTLSELGNSSMSIEVDQVATAADFQRAILSRDYDVILADYQLPDFDGITALQQALEITPATPFIFVSGTMGEDVAIDALRRGASDYVFKNCLEKLVPSVLRAVREKENFNRRIHSEQEVQRISEAMRQNQKMVSIGRMAATIAHETNNPLESVVNLLFLLRDEVISDDGKRYVAAAERELARVIDITRQTLNFYREASKPLEVRMAGLLDEVLSLYRRKLRLKNVTLDKEIATCRTLLALPGELRQVISNVIVNSIDATPPGGRIRVRLKETRSWGKEGKCGVKLLVGDNGSGISPQSLRRIGDAFFTTKGQEGTGLGMWVTRGIIRKYGGRMQLCSSTRDKRHGTVISIFLPYAHEEASEMTKSPEMRPEEVQSSSPSVDEAA